MTPPWWTRHLPQRKAAFHVMAQFARDEGFAEPPIDEVYVHDGLVHLLGESPNGREYGVGYEWTEEQRRRYTPPMPPSPRFDCAAARWPADVLVPLRRLPLRAQG